MTRRSIRSIAGFAILLMVAFLATSAFARGGGRGGGGRGGGGRGGGSFSHGGGGRPNVSRSGPASGGSFSRGASSRRGGNFDSRSRGDRQGNRSSNQSDRQSSRNDNQGDRQDNRNDRYDDRQDNRNDRYDDRKEFYQDRRRFAVGATMTAAAFGALTCASRTVVVNGISYYGCGGTWYNRAYAGGAVSYVVVDAPAGY